MIAPELLGYAASGLTTASFVPQVWRTWRTRSTDDLSYSWLALFGTGVGLWIVYGFWLEAMPIIIGNIATFALVGLISWIKIAPRFALPLKEPA